MAAVGVRITTCVPTPHAPHTADVCDEGATPASPPTPTPPPPPPPTVRGFGCVTSEMSSFHSLSEMRGSRPCVVMPARNHHHSGDHAERHRARRGEGCAKLGAPAGSFSQKRKPRALARELSQEVCCRGLATLGSDTPVTCSQAGRVDVCAAAALPRVPPRGRPAPPRGPPAVVDGAAPTTRTATATSTTCSRGRAAPHRCPAEL